MGFDKTFFFSFSFFWGRGGGLVWGGFVRGTRVRRKRKGGREGGDRLLGFYGSGFCAAMMDRMEIL